MKNITINLLPNGIVSVCGVRIGMTRKQAQDALTTNGYEPKDAKNCVYIQNVVFESDMDPVNNVTFGIDETYRVSHIRIVTNPTDKVLATRFYERFLSATKDFSIPIVYQDKWLTENKTLATFYTNYINSVLVSCNFFTRKWTGEIDPTSSHTTFSVRSIVDLDSDAKIVKEKYYKLLDDIYTWQMAPIVPANHNNTKVWLALALSAVAIVFAFFLGRITKSDADNTINGFYSSEAKEENTKDRGVVYICTGLNAKKYHSTSSCRWLENCSGDIKEVPLSVAEQQEKTPCKGCYK